MFTDVMTELRLFENNRIENKVLDLVFHFFLANNFEVVRFLVLHESKETVIVLFNLV